MALALFVMSASKRGRPDGSVHASLTDLQAREFLNQHCITAGGPANLWAYPKGKSGDWKNIVWSDAKRLMQTKWHMLRKTRTTNRKERENENTENEGKQKKGKSNHTTTHGGSGLKNMLRKMNVSKLPSTVPKTIPKISFP